MKWYEINGNGHDVVISSRVRLARNLEDFPFTPKLDAETSEKIAEKVVSALKTGLGEELVKLCQNQLGWKRTTTYTVIKRLGDRGVLKNDNGTITSLVSKDEAQACEIDELVEKKFEGSLPAFIAAFTKHQAMSEDELDEIQRMIDRIRKGGSQ